MEVIARVFGGPQLPIGPGGDLHRGAVCGQDRKFGRHAKAGVIRPIFPNSVNQRLPSGPVVMSFGEQHTGYWVMLEAAAAGTGCVISPALQRNAAPRAR